MRWSAASALFLLIVLGACASPAPESTATAVPSLTPTQVSTNTPTPTSTVTLTPTPSLPSYGVIDPNIGEKLKAEGIVIPDELKNPEYDLNFATEYFAIHWAEPYPGVKMPIGVVPERGIADGKYHIKGIGATQDALNELAKQHIKIMWMHYREYGNPEDREITLEQYVELLKAGRGGFEIPQYNPETGFFDKKAMVNPLSGYVKVISDNTKKELPLKGTDQNSMLFYVDENGMVWSVANDLEFTIVPMMESNSKSYKEKPYTREPYLAKVLMNGPGLIGLSSNECLAATNPLAACVRAVAKMDDKYTDLSVGIIPLFNEWLAKHEAGDHNAQPPMWIEH